MAEVVRAQDNSEYAKRRAAHRKQRDAANVTKQAKTEYKGKRFEALTDSEKDKLLKVLAISAGLIDK